MFLSFFFRVTCFPACAVDSGVTLECDCEASLFSVPPTHSDSYLSLVNPFFFLLSFHLPSRLIRPITKDLALKQTVPRSTSVSMSSLGDQLFYSLVVWLLMGHHNQHRAPVSGFLVATQVWSLLSSPFRSSTLGVQTTWSWLSSHHYSGHFLWLAESLSYPTMPCCHQLPVNTWALDSFPLVEPNIPLSFVIPFPIA